MTEGEAKKKWCPLVRVGNEAGCNRSSNDFGATAHCIASACMAWRVSQAAREADIQIAECETGKAPDGEDWEISDSGVDEATEGHARYEWTEWQRVRKPAIPELGYCGAFGASVGAQGTTNKGDDHGR